MAGNARVWAAAVVALVIAGGCGLAGGSDDKQLAGGTAASAAPTGPQFEVVSESPSPSPSAAAKKKPAPKSSSQPSVEKTQPAFWSELPPCAYYDKTKQVSKKKVKSALKAAATRVYWRTEAPDLRVSYPLVKAVAWQESGWQSNIHNCDGGTGVMQVMPNTVDFVNNRFGLTYDASKFQDNVLVGTNYLAWLTRWVGDNYFKHSYDLSPKKCKSSSSWCLLNVVISGYNAGQGGIEAAAADRVLPNPEYVAAVRAHMSRCQCDQF